jgi:hypothetical protein
MGFYMVLAFLIEAISTDQGVIGYLKFIKLAKDGYQKENKTKIYQGFSPLQMTNGGEDRSQAQNCT